MNAFLPSGILDTWSAIIWWTPPRHGRRKTLAFKTGLSISICWMLGRGTSGKEGESFGRQKGTHTLQWLKERHELKNYSSKLWCRANHPLWLPGTLRSLNLDTGLVITNYAPCLMLPSAKSFWKEIESPEAIVAKQVLSRF